MQLCRLYDILHTPTSLTLVFEYAEKDLKGYMNTYKNLLLREPFVTKVCASSQQHLLPNYAGRSRGFALIYGVRLKLSNNTAAAAQQCAVACTLAHVACWSAAVPL